MKKDLFIDIANITLGIFAIFCFGVAMLPNVQYDVNTAPLTRLK